jgi:membrane protease YdiL (CAAX protease family)
VTDITKPGSPHVVTAILTLVVACFALVTFARGYRDRWEYPLLSLEDPARSIFLWAEYERRVEMVWPGDAWRKAWFMEQAAATWKQLEEEVARAGPSSSDRPVSLKVVTTCARVVAAGWGEPEAIADVRGMSEEKLPGYLAERIGQIKRGDTETDRTRADTAVRWYVGLWLFDGLAVGVGFFFLLLLGRHGRAFAGDGQTGQIVVFGGAQAWVILSWSFAADALAWRLSYVGIPVLSDIARNLHSLLFALVGVTLVRTTRASDSPAPLRRMFAIPKEPGTKPLWFFLALVAYGASLTFAYLLNWAFGALGRGAPTEFLVEPLIYGSRFDAFANALELVVFAPVGEELLFRGVLFGALARKFTTHRAALVSAVLFSLWHGYGVAGTLIVAFDGYLFARLYARSGSLIPGMFAHAMINFGVCLINFGCRA